MNIATITKEVVVPEVGIGATVHFWSDAHACTVVEVSKSGKRIVVQQDDAKRTDTNGMSDCQSYEYTPNPTGCTWTFSLRANGRWILAGDPAKGGISCGLGYRRKYYDFSF